MSLSTGMRLGREVAIKISAGASYLVMEYIEGRPLEGPLPLQKALDYAAQILDALDAAHQKRITHRDLKPANILVAKNGATPVIKGCEWRQAGRTSYAAQNAHYINDWSPDGRFVLFTETSPVTQSDLWLVPLAGDRKPVTYLRTAFPERQGRFSPDGKWIAYASDESGREEVYVQSLPASGTKLPFRSGGGTAKSCIIARRKAS